ncbi:MAG: DUF6597 domain-containing transcriptional factor [Saprospiraceae bacterium]
MHFQELHPSRVLQPYINCIWWYSEGNTVVSTPERAIPDGCCELIFHLGNRVQRISEKESVLNPRCNFIGPMTRPYLIQSNGKMNMIGVRFYPHTAALFFKEKLWELRDQVIALDMLWGQSAAELAEQLHSKATASEQVALLEQFLIQRLANQRVSIHPIAQHAIQQIIQQRGLLDIGKLCQRLRISTRYLELIFREAVGLTPKFFSRLIQFQQTFRHLPQARSLTDLAYLSHYTDQSHFIRNCRQLTGLTPKKFFSTDYPLHDNFTQEDSISYLYNF